MPSPACLDFAALLAPIPGDNPAGESVPFLVRKKLEEGRKEVNPNSFAPDDPRRPEKPVYADWTGINRIAQETLTEKSKDLLVAARLTEALVKEYGFAGLRDGLHLLRELVGECWDRIHPAIEDGDLEVRAAAFNWLDDEVRGARFAFTLRTAPLITGDDGAYGWQHWKESQDATGSVTREVFDKAMAATPREFCQNVVDDLAQGLEELNGLIEILTAKLGEAAPGLTTIRKAMTECEGLAKQILGTKGPPPGSADESAGDGQAAGPDAGPGLGRSATGLTTRDEVYAQLARVAAQLMRLEPQSPISYLVQRAVKLSRLPFPQLMKILIRDANILNELSRELDLGIDETPETLETPEPKPEE